MIKLKNTRASTTSCRRSLTVHRLLLQRPVRYYLPREIIFVIAAVHGARVTAPALMDLPVDSRSHGFSQTDMGVEHLNQFTDTHEYPRRVFPSFYKEFLFPIIDFIPILENPRHLFLLFFSFFFYEKPRKKKRERAARWERSNDKIRIRPLSIIFLSVLLHMQRNAFEQRVYKAGHQCSYLTLRVRHRSYPLFEGIISSTYEAPPPTGFRLESKRTMASSWRRVEAWTLLWEK